MIDLTDKLSDCLRSSALATGSMNIFISGSTAAVTTIEFEPGLVKDFPAMLEQIAPRDRKYHHDATWHDGNGHAHVRASLLGPSLTVPFSDNRLLLGTWQQVVLLDFDTRPRTRDIVVQCIGE